MSARFGRLASTALALLVFAGPAIATAWPFGLHRADRLSVEAGETAVEQARCYGRYVGFRSALYDAIQSTDSWLASNEQAGEVDAMQAAFLARLVVERRTILQPEPDLDETAMPSDVRKSYDRGLDETVAEFEKPANRDKRARILAESSTPAPQRMAKLQSALEDSFSALRTPCVAMIEKYKAGHVAAQGRASSLATEQTASQPDAAAWEGSQWIQVGVIDRPAGAPETWDPKAQWPDETRGLSERTEMRNHGGKNRRVALIGPFIDARQVRAFCLRLKAHGGACGAPVTRMPPGQTSAASCGHDPRCRVAVRTQRKTAATRSGAVTLVSRQGVQDLTAGLRGRVSE